MREGDKAPAVAGQPCRNHRYASERRAVFKQVVHCPVKLGAVVNTPAEHYLRVDIYPGVGHAAQVGGTLPARRLFIILTRSSGFVV